MSFVVEETYPDYQQTIASDINSDGNLDVLDIVEIVNVILEVD